MYAGTKCAPIRRQARLVRNLVSYRSLLVGLPLIAFTSARADNTNTAYATRTYSFAIESGKLRNVVDTFARQAGLDVVVEGPSDATVSLVTTEPLSFKEALSRVRTLLFGYKQVDPYWLLVDENHVEVLRVCDYYRRMPLERMYTSLEAFQAANLQPDDLALLVFAPENVEIGTLKALRNFVPDYMRISPLADDQGAVSVYGLVKDIDRYVKLVRKLGMFLKAGDGAPAREGESEGPGHGNGR